MMRASRAMPKGPPPTSGTSPAISAPSICANSRGSMAISSSLEGKMDEVHGPVKDTGYRALVGLSSQLDQELAQGRGVFSNGRLAREALDQDRLVPDQPPTLRIISPGAPAARERGRSAEVAP